jgi:DnaJ like chaperone protein
LNTGKIIGGLIGFMVAGPFTALLGVFVGHQFDKGLGGVLRPMSAQEQALIRSSYFETLFGLLGHLAKSDGRISKVEIAQAEALMANMGLDASSRRAAIELFQQGSKADFSVDQTMAQFNSVCGRQQGLKRSLLNYLLALAMADGELHPAEQDVLQTVARHLGFSAALFKKFIEMVKAQSQFRGSGQQSQRASTRSQLDSAYTALGVKASSTDGQVKKAYRKLISENHPDKLIGQGMPEDMVKLATERTQEIQTAYDYIVAHRK